MSNRTVFVDRDGTINENTGYIKNPEDLVLYPKVSEGIRLLNKNGYKVIVITNQSGISRGYFSEETLEKIHNKMKEELSKKDAFIDAIYFCPHHPDENCKCRKPQPGLLKTAIKEFDVDVSKSFIIGDRMLDIEAGNKVGCKTILVPEKKEIVKNEMEKSNITPDYIANDFVKGVEWIIANNNY